MVDDPGAVAALLAELRIADARDAITTIAGHAVSRVRLGDADRVAALQRQLNLVGASDAITICGLGTPSGTSTQATWKA